ncbi:NeuD/PglB/VioB family sugar acetyltransferase [Lysinibacillus capsici]|uniref:NeuD/PglB/VioB family sugar acetyltransferase n=1 Tax=Lysinibacillus capsici TaxID=2115968 RepID=UPI00308175A2|nr:NeuD/PglB/VioB family sugar acetyltransferase [Lysinibacillus capsici]
MKKLGIFGSSGMAREVADIAIDLGYKEIFFIDLESRKEEVSGYEIISEDEIGSICKNTNFIIGIGEGGIREKIYNKFSELNYINLIHPSATLGFRQKEKLLCSKGNILCAGTRLTNNIHIGDFGIFNLNTTVTHDCVIGDFVTISPGANISGNVHLKKGSYIGTGSTILQGKNLKEKLIVGEYATVGAGAVVVKDVPAHTIVKGVPAK